MYISKLSLWNFRKYGSLEFLNLAEPSLIVNLNMGMNILIGENDSGKSAIIDAIKLVLKTNAYEWIKILAMIRFFNLTVDHAFPEEIIANSFDIFDDYEFVEGRDHALSDLVNAFVLASDFNSYSQTNTFNS